SDTSFNQDINHFDVKNAKEIHYMFRNNNVFSKDISSWQLGNLTRAEGFMGNGFGTDNLNAFYQSLAGQTLKPGVNLGMGNNKYGAGFKQYRDILTGSPNNWIISDGGQA